MLRIAALLLSLILSPLPCAAADAYPSKPVRLIVGGGPGSVSDVRSRWIAQKLTAELGQPVVVENRAGAGASIAAQQVARSPADGYTLLLIHVGILVAPDIYPNTGFDPIADFAPVSRISRGYGVLTVHPAVPVRSVEDLIKLAQERPGKLNYGSTGLGGPPWFMGELFKRQAQVDVTHVMYKGGGELMADLLAGRIDFWIEGVLIQLEHVKAGRLRALAVTAPQRLELLPEVPTLREAGLPNYDFQGWTGLVAPAATPRAAIDRLNSAMRKVLAMPETLHWLAEQANEPVAESPEEFGAFMRAERTKWSPLVKEASAKARL